MPRRISLATQTRLSLLIALALLIRALVPTGWMPVAGPDGMHLTLCPGQGAMAHSMPGMKGGADHRGGALPDHPCAFAGLGLAADTAPPPLILPNRATPAVEPRRDQATVAVGRGLAAPPPPATGPPAFA